VCPEHEHGGGGGRLTPDTAFNILQTKEFCVSIISEPFVEASNYTAIDTPPGTDEWALAGLTKKQSE
jgi:flavin reductase (DIM6/NTAB) family NADH-FMN oxidoreductase RutF